MSEYYPNPLPVSGAPRTSSLAIVSLVTGIASWAVLPLLAALAAVITGHLAKKEIKNSAGAIAGGGMATAGLVLGYVQIGLFSCACVVVALLLAFGVSIPFISNTTY